MKDLEFASIMVQNLNLIMITSPELADFRKRLKTLESKVRSSHLLLQSETDVGGDVGWTDSVHDLVPIVVSQCSRYFLSLSSCRSLRAGLLAPPDLVSTHTSAVTTQCVLTRTWAVPSWRSQSVS